MEKPHVLAIDFGTSNSYFSLCHADQLFPSGINLRSDREGMHTAVLYREGRMPLVGYEAVEEWLNASDVERKSYRLRTHFKPDIISNQEAFEDAKNFLEITRKQLEQAHVISDPRELQVIIGVPSEFGKPYNKRLCKIAELAGYGRIQTKDEPIGALLYHISNKTLSARDAHRGILVVDFGGGTCDFAYMQSLRVCHSWGQPLGGRFFDDIFFQWFLEENPESLPIMKESRAEGFVQWFECKQVKESFSRKMTSDKEQTVRSRIGNYGFLHELTWDSFIKRSESYQPTKSFLDYLSRTNDDSKGIIERNSSINLINWFRKSLAEGLKEKSIDKSDISRVILTGGSSQWLFVEEILSETLHIDSSCLLRSGNPYAAISMGLAILPALQNEFQEKKAKLSQDKKGFVENSMKSSLNTKVGEISSSVAEEITIYL